MLFVEIPITASFLARDESSPSRVAHMEGCSLIQGGAAASDGLPAHANTSADLMLASVLLSSF